MYKQSIKSFYQVFILSLALIFMSQFLFSCASMEQLFNQKSDSSQQDKSSSPNPGGVSAIHVIDSNTFRIDESYDVIWDTLLTVLIRNYDITFVDQESGIITTDWDALHVKDQLIRNKVTVKVKKLSFKNTEIVFHNSVEKLKIASSYVWVPEQDKYGEVSRIVNNIAIMLNQPPVKISSQSEGDTRKVFTR